MKENGTAFEERQLPLSCALMWAQQRRNLSQEEVGSRNGKKTLLLGRPHLPAVGWEHVA